MTRFELPYYNHTIMNIVKSYCNYEILNNAQKTYNFSQFASEVYSFGSIRFRSNDEATLPNFMGHGSDGIDCTGLRPESKLNRNVLFESPRVKKVVQECSLHPSVFVHAALNHALDKLEKVLTRAPALFSVNLRTGDRRKIKLLTFEGYETLIVAI